MDTHSGVRPALFSPQRSDTAGEFAPGPTMDAGEPSDPLRARYTLTVDVDHLLRTGQTRRILRLSWMREEAVEQDQR